MAPQAPLRSRTVGFPESGSGLGSARHFPEAGLPRPSKAQAMARVHPRCPWFTCPLAPIPGPPRAPSTESGCGPSRRNRRVPRAPLPDGGVTHARAVSGTASGDVTPPSQLIRAHAPVPPPLSAFGFLVLRVFAGCCHPLLVVGPSRHYPRNPCGGDWTHTPPCPPGALAHFFSGGIGLTLRERRSAHGKIPAMRLQQGAGFRGCSHSLMFSLPHSLDPPVAPTAMPEGTGRPGRLHHASPGGLPRPGCGIAT
jgi:hypothetical protein